jgi:hypothetical protein
LVCEPGYRDFDAWTSSSVGNMVCPLCARSELQFLCAFIIPIPAVSTLKVQQMIRVHEILQNAKAKGNQVLETDDVVEISTGLISYLLFTTGTHPNNRGMLRLDEPEVPVKDQKPSLSRECDC